MDENSKKQSSLLLCPEELHAAMNLVFENEYFDTTDLIYRAYLWMLFAGIDKNETITVRKDELDFVNMHISHGGIVYPIYQQAYTSMEKLSRLSSFEIMNVYDSRPMPTNKQRTNSPFLLAGLSDILSTDTFKFMISRKAIKAGVSITPKYVEMSGVFYRFASLPDDWSVRKKMSQLSCKDKRLLQRNKEDFNQWMVHYQSR